MTPTTPPEPVAGDRPPSTLAATACALLTMGIGLVDLVGWGAGLEPLTRLGHDSTPMSPASASVAIVLAASLLGLSFQARWRGARLAAILAAAVGLAMSLTLLLVPGAAIEKLLAQSGAIAPGFQIFSTTGRASLLLAGTAATVSAAMLFQLLGRTPARKDIAGAVGLACAAGGSLFLIGYAYGSPLLSGNNSVPVSLPSARDLVDLGVDRQVE